MPSDKVLYRAMDDDGRFTLEMLFGTPFSDIVVDEFIVRVILPEGADEIQYALHLFHPTRRSFVMPNECRCR
jgi:hypothetical protein